MHLRRAVALTLALVVPGAFAFGGETADRYLPSRLFGLLKVPGVVVAPLEDQGADDHWHRSWIVRGMQAPEGVLRAAERSLDNPFLPAPAPWQRMAITQRPEDPPTSAWFLTDERGRYWEGLLRVRHDPSEPGALLVSVDIERSDSEAHGSGRTGPPDPRLRLGQARVGQDPPRGLDVGRERLSQNGRFRVRFEPQPDPVAPGLRPTWLLQIDTPGGQGVEGAEIEAGGGQPQTGAPLPGTQSVRRGRGAGEYLVEGMEFPGGSTPAWWEVRFLIRAGVAEDVVIFNLFVPSVPREAGA